MFALPFAAVGLWMLWSVSTTLLDAWQMQDWVPVEARITAGGYTTRDGSDTYEAYAEYRYRYEGRDYSGSRVAVAAGADNIGDYQQEMGRRLRRAIDANQPVTVYVNPEAPSQAIIDRDVRWGMVGFKMIFVIVFGGVGFALLYGTFMSGSATDRSDPALSDTPWLQNEAWQTNTIRSNSRAAMWGAWGFAVFWNAISAFAPFIAYREVVDNGNFIALIALVFPLVGIGLLAWAVMRTLEWRRFGPAPVVLDPFPGSIGGHVGGTIDVNLPFAAGAKFEVTLTNIHTHYSGSGKNRSREETAKWQDTLVAHAQPGARGTRLAFCFEVPEGLHESDSERDDDVYEWRLNLSAELPGADIDRSYEIPVFATRQASRHLSGYAVERARAKQAALEEEAVRDLIHFEHGPTGRRLFFPAGRMPGLSLGGLLVGVIFAGAGWYVLSAKGQTVFGSIFGGIGLLVALACVYALCNSLEVVQTSTGIRTLRRLFGIPIGGSELRRDEIASLDTTSSIRTQAGGKHVIYYNVCAVDRNGREHVIGVGFEGERQAKAATRLIAREFGLRLPEREQAPGADEDPLGPSLPA